MCLLAGCAALMSNMRETLSQGGICTKIHQTIEILQINWRGESAHPITPLHRLLHPACVTQVNICLLQLAVCEDSKDMRISKTEVCVILDSIHSPA